MGPIDFSGNGSGIVCTGKINVPNCLDPIEDALRGRTTARPPLVNGHEFDSQPSCLASGDKHPWRTLEIGRDLA